MSEINPEAGVEAFLETVSELPLEVLDIFPIALAKSVSDLLPEKQKEHLLKTFAIRRNIRNESDRGTALYLSSYLDQILAEAIQSRIVADTAIHKAMFEGTGGLATFSARIDMSYLLGIISKDARSDLNLIRKIRNEFAHSYDNVDFNAHQIKNRCDNFKIWIPGGSNPKNKFISCVMSMIAYISGNMANSDRIQVRDDYLARNEGVKKAWHEMDSNPNSSKVLNIVKDLTKQFKEDIK